MDNAQRIRALLFDLDGTLVDTSGGIAHAVNSALAEAGALPLSTGQCMQHVGRGLRNTLVGALAERDIQADADRLEYLLGVLKATYRDEPLKDSFPYPGIVGLLEKSVAGNLRLGVLSNKDDSLVKVITRALFGETPFIMIQGAAEGVPLKPDPSKALEFAGKAGCRTDEVLLIGDSEVDHLTAEAAGMRGAIVTWGFRSRGALESSGCEPLFDTVEELETEVFP